MLITFSASLPACNVRSFRDALQDHECKPSAAELWGPAAVAGATLIGARLLNVVAASMG